MDRKKICFFISPIGEETSNARNRSDAVIRKVLNPAFDAFEGFSVIRADHEHDGRKVRMMIDHLKGTLYCIADITGYNPNVMWEIGYREAVGLPLLLIREKGKEKSPFDI